MKKLIAMVTVALTLNANALVECEKNPTTGRWYPKNELAKKIASNLGVKTCQGGRFKAVVKGLNEKTNVPASKKNMSVDEVLKELAKK